MSNPFTMIPLIQYAWHVVYLFRCMMNSGMLVTHYTDFHSRRCLNHSVHALVVRPVFTIKFSQATFESLSLRRDDCNHEISDEDLATNALCDIQVDVLVATAYPVEATVCATDERVHDFAANLGVVYVPAVQSSDEVTDLAERCTIDSAVSDELKHRFENFVKTVYRRMTQIRISGTD